MTRRQTEFSQQIFTLKSACWFAIFASGKREDGESPRYNPSPAFALSAKNWFTLALPAILCDFWERISSTI
jgi:hypothetical protein